MSEQTARDDRVTRLVELNDQLRETVESVEDAYENCERIAYRGSALVNILRFETTDAYPNDGMLMFVYRYSDETDAYTLECHMEVNYRTVPDNQDRYRFAAGEEDVDPESFVETKIEQFEQIYSDPPELMAR